MGANRDFLQREKDTLEASISELEVKVADSEAKLAEYKKARTAYLSMPSSPTKNTLLSIANNKINEETVTLNALKAELSKLNNELAIIQNKIDEYDRAVAEGVSKGLSDSEASGNADKNLDGFVGDQLASKSASVENEEAKKLTRNVLIGVGILILILIIFFSYKAYKKSKK